MFKTILVALDGFKEDEAVLRYASELALSVDAELVLLRAAMAHAVAGVNPAEAEVAALTAAEEYLERLEEQLRAGGLKVRSVAPYGPAVDAILEEAKLHGADAILMASASAGSPNPLCSAEAQRVLRQATEPVFLVFIPPASRPHPGPADHSFAPRCHNCGRTVRLEMYTAQDRCPRCGYYLRACSNCEFYDGIVCLMDNPQLQESYAHTDCQDFQFQLTPAPAARAG